MPRYQVNDSECAFLPVAKARGSQRTDLVEINKLPKTWQEALGYEKDPTGWFYAFLMDPNKAVDDLLRGAFYFRSLNPVGPDQLLVEWLKDLNKQDDFCSVLDAALTRWIKINWTGANDNIYVWCLLFSILRGSVDLPIPLRQAAQELLKQPPLPRRNERLYQEYLLTVKVLAKITDDAAGVKTMLRTQPLIFRVWKTNSNAMLPTKQHDHDIGFDLAVCRDETFMEHQHRTIDLGIVVQAPLGYYFEVVPRSSLFGRHGLLLVNGVGIIDPNYCGPNDILKATFWPTYTTTIPRGSRIMQLIPRRVIPGVSMEDTTKTPHCTDDRGGVGSTGV